MRIHSVPPMFSFALLIGIAASPVTACELEQEAASHRTVTAFLTEHGRAATFTPLPQLVACKADGSACAADAECCSGACKPIGEDELAYPNSEPPLFKNVRRPAARWHRGR